MPSVLWLLVVLPLHYTFVRAEEPESQEAAAEQAANEQTAVKEGHSYHGEVFNEGPRQAAYLMGGTGNVSFPITCQTEQTQQFFDQGVGQLHGFWYFESERSFRQVAALEPECAMAYWGMAMSNRGNEKRARGFMAKATEFKDKVTPREKAWIEMWAEFFKEPDEKQKADKDYEKNRRQKLVAAFEKLLYDHPEDLEAKAFLTLAIYENKAKGIPISSHFAVDALMKEVLAVNRLHPVHHFRIHLWDYEQARLALDSSALCGESAPAIAHMWHMPGHIYSRLHRYHEAVWQQEASARVDHAHMQRDRVLPDQIHNFAHNNEWLIRNLIYLGDRERALSLARNMCDLPRHPKYNTFDKQGSAHFGRLRLMELLEKFELWDLTLELAGTAWLEPTHKPTEQDKLTRLLAVARFEAGDVMGGTTALTEIKQRLTKLRAEQEEATTAAESKAREEKKDDKGIKDAREAAGRKFNESIRRLEQLELELSGYVHAAHAAPGDALASFQKVNGLPKRKLAQAQWEAGEQPKCLETLRQEVKENPQQVLPLAHLVEKLWQAGVREEAQQRFEELRKLAGVADLTLPAMQRLQPIARELNWPDDWRIPFTYPADFGERPALESLGPFRWAPSSAPGWELADYQSQTVSLAQYRGKNVVVLFYLGHACLHCAEQLQAFAPQVEKFRQQGIEIVAISTDSPADLKLSHEMYKDGPFPFPLVSNEGLDVFRSYRCYDDFEQQPLHGTFVIDAQGLIRWQDIGHEPFMKVDFVLQEAQRLLHPESRTLQGPVVAAAEE